MTHTLVVMGPSGCGKSTVGAEAARLADVPFFEGDAYHSARNVSIMRAGGALSDADRVPWIEAIGADVTARAPAACVLACSALSQVVRDALVGALPGEAVFALLVVPADELRRRLAVRRDHFAGPALLESQIRAMDDAVGVTRLDGTQPVAAVAARAAALLQSSIAAGLST